MALPAIISTTNLRLGSDSNAGDSGPWYLEGAVHGLFFDTSTLKVEIWTDTPPDRGENFAVADSANSPSGNSTANLNKPCGVIINELIWAIYPDSSANLAAAPFSRVTNSWGSVITSSLPRVEPTSATSVGGGLTAVALPGGLVRVLHNSTKVSSKDTIYFVDLDPVAGSFGSQTILHGGSGSANYAMRSAIVGSGGITHAFYIDDASPRNLYHRSIAPDGTLGTEQTVATGIWWDIGDALYVPSAGAVQLAVPYGLLVPSQVYHSLRIATADSATDPTWSTAEVSADPVLYTEAFFGAAYASVVNMDGDVHYAHEGSAIADLGPPSSANLNIYRRVFDGSSWGGSQDLVNEATDFALTPRIRRSDNGLGCFFVRGSSGAGSYYYTEIEIDPCGATVNLVGAAY